MASDGGDLTMRRCVVGWHSVWVFRPFSALPVLHLAFHTLSLARLQSSTHSERSATLLAQPSPAPVTVTVTTRRRVSCRSCSSLGAGRRCPDPDNRATAKKKEGKASSEPPASAGCSMRSTQDGCPENRQPNHPQYHERTNERTNNQTDRLQAHGKAIFGMALAAVPKG
ncbi:uncharacterized protein IWZ02DRAFT_446509 [Phyllosticta citriasiana]|uniref:uncharacterized protein n=1 Tax=Phyllosticta citriasiana TaxID=595635 RepID=UPI0030FDCBF1